MTIWALYMKAFYVSVGQRWLIRTLVEMKFLPLIQTLNTATISSRRQVPLLLSSKTIKMGRVCAIKTPKTCWPCCPAGKIRSTWE